MREHYLTSASVGSVATRIDAHVRGIEADIEGRGGAKGSGVWTVECAARLSGRPLRVTRTKPRARSRVVRHASE